MQVTHKPSYSQELDSLTTIDFQLWNLLNRVTQKGLKCEDDWKL